MKKINHVVEYEIDSLNVRHSLRVAIFKTYATINIQTIYLTDGLQRHNINGTVWKDTCIANNLNYQAEVIIKIRDVIKKHGDVFDHNKIIMEIVECEFVS